MMQWPNSAVLSLEEVHVRRGGADVLRGVNARFAPGRRYVIAGPSGSGKSTLLRLLNRLEDPAEGRVMIGQTPLADLPPLAVRGAVGLVFQSPRPLPGTLADNLSYPARIRRRAIPAKSDLAAALDEVGLNPDWLDRDVEGLSGGERQRLAIATALQAAPEILVLDEPTAALDPAAIRKIVHALDERAKTGLRTICVTHHRQHAALLGETCFVLDGGRIVDERPVAEALARHDAESWGAPNSKAET